MLTRFPMRESGPRSIATRDLVALIVPRRKSIPRDQTCPRDQTGLPSLASAPGVSKPPRAPVLPSALLPFLQRRERTLNDRTRSGWNENSRPGLYRTKRGNPALGRGRHPSRSRRRPRRRKPGLAALCEIQNRRLRANRPCQLVAHSRFLRLERGTSSPRK